MLLDRSDQVSVACNCGTRRPCSEHHILRQPCLHGDSLQTFVEHVAWRIKKCVYQTTRLRNFSWSLQIHVNFVTRACLSCSHYLTHTSMCPGYVGSKRQVLLVRSEQGSKMRQDVHPSYMTRPLNACSSSQDIGDYTTCLASILQCTLDASSPMSLRGSYLHCCSVREETQQIDVLRRLQWGLMVAWWKTAPRVVTNSAH